MANHRREVILGVCGGIAAYKACELLRLFTEDGDHVTVVPTPAALRFVGTATWEALSGRPVATDVFTDAAEVPHVSLGRRADLVVVAPATADLLARAAMGRADDLLTSTLLTARCPVVFAPTMHTEMWEHPATVDNVTTLRARGNIVIDPAEGRLTGVDTGKGRLPEPAEIHALAQRVWRRGHLDGDLQTRHIVVTAGGTREPLDPVRFLGNRSSGKQGYALAKAAVARGAEVSLVAANVQLPDPAGVHVIPVETAQQLREATHAAAHHADAVVMAAAPSDFRPAEYTDTKLKKADHSQLPFSLVANPDIAAEIGASVSADQRLVAFAAETDQGRQRALEKLSAKNADMIVLNQVGNGRAFGTEDNTVTLLWPDGSSQHVPSGSKDAVADAILDALNQLW